MKHLRHFLAALALSFSAHAFALAPLPVKPDVVVAPDGSGDFTSVNAAVQSIPHDNRERKIILIKDGLYPEKVRIDASRVTLRGESRAGTRIEFAVARGTGGDDRDRSVVSIDGDDVVLENLTIKNTHGVLGIHAFAVYGRGDKTVIQDADVLSHGNDTLSLWRTSNGRYSEDAAEHTQPNGRYYHANLKVCGSVDFICPRGWCYLRDSEMTELNPKSEAAMWHDGSRDPDMKFVMVRCRFDGPEGFRLARHHHDALFFFLDCSFAKTMRDAAPYRVIYPLDGGPATEANRQRNQELDATNRWGERAYFFNSHRDGGDYAWLADNLAKAPGAPTPAQITAKWTFAGTWDPERTDAPKITAFDARGAGQFVVTFSEPVTAKGHPRLIFANGEIAEFVGGSGTNRLAFAAPSAIAAENHPKLDFHGGAIIACEAGAAVRVADPTF